MTNEIRCDEDCGDDTTGNCYSPNFRPFAVIGEFGKVEYLVEKGNRCFAISREDWLAIVALKQAGCVEGIRTLFEESFHSDYDGNFKSALESIARSMP